MNGRQLALSVIAVICMVAASFGLGMVVGRRLGPAFPSSAAANADSDKLTAVDVTLETSADATSPVTETVPAASHGGAPAIVFFDDKGQPQPQAGASAQPTTILPAGNAAQPSPAPGAKADPVAVTPAAAPRPPPKGADVARKEAAKAAVQSPKPSSESKAEQGRYTIQISAFRDEPPAQQLKNEIKGKGYEAYIQKVSLGNKGTWYRVRVGRFKTKDSANIVAERLRLRDGLRGYITVADQ